LGRVLEREKKRWFRVIYLKVVYGGLMNAYREKGGRERGRSKEGIGEQEGKMLLEGTEKNERKTAARKQVEDLHHSSSSNGHKFYIKIANFLLLSLFSHPSVYESFSPLDGRLNWIPASE
jgi:hypothetical protein